MCAIITWYPQNGLVWNVYNMKKLILRAVSIMMLTFGITFAGALSPLQDTSNPLLQTAYADEDDESSSESSENNKDNSSSESTGNDNATSSADSDNPCQAQSDSVAWILCPVMRTMGNLVDSFYEFIEQLLIVQPLSTDEDSSVIQVWRVARDLTNICFVIFALIVIYSQLTGLGINNYGVKRILPRLIIAVILVNLSFLICSIGVDISNVVGSSITGFLGHIQSEVLANADLSYHLDVLWSTFTRALTGGGIILGISVAAFAGIEAIFWGVLLALLGAIISLGIGLVTIALRQGLILILVMIAPLAFLAYLLPNTEKWFEKWKNLFFQMLFFYPMFSFLFGAAKLAGWAIIASANANLFVVLVGMIVEVIPIFFSFSLFKMSGTILGDVNSALQKLSAPARGGLAGWATSHQELARQKYIGSSPMPGAHLRRFLDKRKQLREDDTAAAAELRKNIAAERAFNKAASYRGLDAEGNAMVGGRGLFNGYANRHTRLHKRSEIQKLLAATAQQNLANNLSDYDKTFRGEAAKRLSASGANAFLDNTKQQFRAENIAMGDQSYLLGRYLQAAKGRTRSPYEFNRLIGGAASSLGHLGEASIIGQVIDRSVQIENRRRREALVVANKFGYSKADFRGMVFDKARINDDGYEEDENGQVIEDADYNLLPGKKHRSWGKYVAIHKTTNKEISKDEYLRLSQGQRNEYKKVRYMEIKDDEGDVIQKVFDDDAGYMKELLRQDIAIGDPINVRYLNEIGLARQPSEYTGLAAQYASKDRTGILRRYHSTITAAMLESKYAEHNAAVTAMLTAQANNGFITSTGQYHIAELESLWKAAKSGKLLQNDAPIIRSWKRLIDSLDSTTPGERFEDIFDDASIGLTQNINGMPLHGLRKGYKEDGSEYWYKIDRNDADITIEDKRNWIKHQIFPHVIQKLIGSMDRRPSPTVLDSQKPDGTIAFCELAESAVRVGSKAFDPNTTFDERLSDKNILETKDPQAIQRTINELRNLTYEQFGYDNVRKSSGNNSNRSGGSGQRQNKDGVPMGNHENTYFNKDEQKAYNAFVRAMQTFNAEINNSNEQDNYIEKVNDPKAIHDLLESIFAESGSADITTIGNQVVSVFQNNETLRELAFEAGRIVQYWEDEYTRDPESTADLTHEVEQRYIDGMESEILDLADSASY